MTFTTRQKALRIARAALDSKADDLVILDLRKRSATFDYFVVCTVTSQRRSQAVADAIEESLETLGARLAHKEGYADGGWVLLDYGSVIGHIFAPELRTFYRLERLWADALRVTVPAGTAAARRS